jgi:hypothetical protein
MIKRVKVLFILMGVIFLIITFCKCFKFYKLSSRKFTGKDVKFLRSIYRLKLEANREREVMSFFISQCLQAIHLDEVLSTCSF